MDDSISRQAAIRAVNTALFPKINTAKDAEKALRDLPPAQPRRGKWAGKGDSEGFGIFVCGTCGKFAMMKSNFCPNCGADMRQREEEQDEGVRKA